MLSLDPIANLALSLKARPGAYAVLLGSGVSTAAGVPTGWAITLDLARRVARAEGEEPVSIETWHQSRFGTAPDYSALLAAVARSPADRRSVIQGYLDPSPEERAEGLKAPTSAHRAVAELAARGIVRVIVTTNFDRLMERALQDAGVTPSVIANADDALGAEPLTHAGCTILKLHGDYMDTRILNTTDELARYEPAIDRLLDRIFDEFGLVVSGWSGVWDTALRDAMARAPSRRYTTYWAHRGPLAPEAEALAAKRDAVRVPVASADALFTSLLAKLDALGDLDRPRPLDAALAVALVKRRLGDPKDRVRLFDQLNDEAGRLAAINLDPVRAPVEGRLGDIGAVARARADVCVSETRPLRLMAAQVGFFGSATQVEDLGRAIVRLATTGEIGNGYVMLLALRRYPAALVFLSALLGAVAGNNYAAVRNLAQLSYRDGRRGRMVTALSGLHPRTLEFGPIYQTGAEDRYFPLDDYLNSDVVRPDFGWWSADEGRISALFDDTLMLWSLLYVDGAIPGPIEEGMHFPTSSFSWRRYGWAPDAEDQLRFAQAAGEGENWPPLRAGLFGGSAERFAALWSAFDAQNRRNQR